MGEDQETSLRRRCASERVIPSLTALPATGKLAVSFLPPVSCEIHKLLLLIFDESATTLKNIGKCNKSVNSVDDKMIV